MFDSLAIAAVRDELRLLLGTRVQRVVQADPLTLGMELYLRSERHWLLLTADPNRAGLWFVSTRVGQAPEAPSPILLLMRKWIRGARLDEVEQPAHERVLRLRFTTWLSDGQEDDATPISETEGLPNHAGAMTLRFDVIVEATGRLGNVILVDEEGFVVEAIKRVPARINRQRTILPRHPYVGPPPQAKAAPEAATEEMLRALLAGAEKPAAPLLVGAFGGMSPLAAREIVHRATGRAATPGNACDPTRIAAVLAELFHGTGSSAARWQPSVGFEGEQLVAFAPYRLTHLDRFEPTDTLSLAAERFFGRSVARAPIIQAQASLRGELDAVVARETRRLEALERELAGSAEADRLREEGDLIFAYASQIAPGATYVEIDGRRISLDPLLTPVENGQHYFERYSRLRDARRRLPAMIDEARAQVAYLRETLTHVSLARSPDEVAAIRAELRSDAPGAVQPGGKRAPGKRDGKGAPARPEPLKIRLGSHVAYVGRSAKQNDVATFALARAEDLWLHARGVAGAHVILQVERGAPDAATIERAAAIAAFQSEARDAGRVEVDVTERRHVRKIKGAPGAVTYSHERTLRVAPQPPDRS